MWPKDAPVFEAASPGEVSRPGADALFFPCLDKGVVGKQEYGTLQPVSAADFRWLGLETDGEHYLGKLRGRECWALEVSGPVPPGHSCETMWGWLGVNDPELFYLAGRARQVVDFHQSHRFCGACGSATEPHASDRARQCPGCGLISYPRLSPSIIVLVTRGDEALLGRQAQWPSGMYSTLAGFVEPGESIEQTVHREVFEEVAIRVDNLRYLGSQSWPFPNSLMLGFHADYAGGEIVCQPDEIEDAQWFRRDALPHFPGVNAISRWLIDAWVEQG